MKQQNSSRSLFLFFVLFISLSLNAQKVFKVGDRVKISPTGLKDEKYWRAGTVTEVHNYSPKKAYSVQCDPLSANDHPSTFLVNEDKIKPLEVETTITPKRDVQQPKPTEKAPGQVATPPAANNVACPASDPDSKGATAFERCIRGAIREDFEREPQLHEDGRTTVSLQSLNIGQSHAWRELQDPIDAKGKTIYEVRSTFTTCTDYFRRIEYVKREREFACYKNNAGKMVCEPIAATNTNIHDQTKSIDKNGK
ncbi:MAG TPA: hypothetical protein VNS32_00080 [Flavisolibacter sp.]|nr:hypothetical protein [Flavisolibacter sp.]